MAGFSHLDTWHDGQLASVRGPLACAAWSAMPLSFEIKVRQRPGGVSRKIVSQTTKGEAGRTKSWYAVSTPTVHDDFPYHRATATEAVKKVPSLKDGAVDALQIPPSDSLVCVSAEVVKAVHHVFSQNNHSPDEDADEDGHQNPCSEKPIIVA